MAAVADHLGGSADGRGHHFVADHHDAQVAAAVVALQQHAAVELAGALDGRLDVLGAAQVDGDALALLAIHRLDHQCAVFGEERGILLRAAGQALLRLAEPGAVEHAVGEGLVLAEGHGDGAGQVAQRLAAADAPAALGEGEEAGGGVLHLHLDAAPVRLVDDDGGVGVEVLFRAGAEEQRLVERVLALDGEGRQLAEGELAVERLGLAVVVQHRQVEIGPTAADEVLHQVPHQRLANARPAALRVHRQAPEAGAILGIVERPGMVQAHHGADHRAGLGVLGQPVGRAAMLARGDLGRLHRQHAARQVQAVDRRPVVVAVHAADAQATVRPARRAVVGEPQAQGVGGVEEQLLRRVRQHLLRRRHVQGDVAFAGAFVEQLLGQRLRRREGMPEQQAAPAAVQDHRFAGLLAVALGEARLQPFVGRRLAAQQALVMGKVGMGFHGVLPDLSMFAGSWPALRARAR
ncbi:hypothetical protein D3C76_886030 [compost metagenome]